jgi:outer membrane protein assembly factor BamD (BamD/ComL family)
VVEKIRLTWLCFWAVSSTALATGPMFDDTPPALPFYLQRLPAKSLEDIYAETSPSAAPPQNIDFRQKVTQLVGELGVRPSSELTNELNRLLVEARHDYGQKEWSGRGLVNLLHDLLDLVSEGNGDRAEWKRYAGWRLQHLDWFGFTGDPNVARADAKTLSERAAELQFQLAGATPSLQPHWMYLLGALGFKSGEDTRSQQWFERVVNQYPNHPRAEAALFMDGRCQLSRARTYSDQEADIQRAAANRPRAQEIFERYLQKYPNGRFAGDAIGWLGAIAYDSGQYLSALQYYLRQTELSAHPELLRPALTMCEKILVRIASKPDQQAFAEVAAHPRLAMGLIYLVVNTTEADNFDGKYDDPETVKQWRQRILPALAAAVSAQQFQYQQNGWKPRYLAILALAASNQGKQDQALKLIGMAGTSIQESDDLSFANTVILQRAGKIPEAITALQAFLDQFANSPLARGARLRLALALQDDHQAGRAIVELKKLLPKTAHSGDADQQAEDAAENAVVNQYPPARADDSDAEPEQVRQLIDTLYNFAPLKELEEVTGRPDLLPETGAEIRAVIAQRYLAAEQFSEAQKYFPPADWQLVAARIAGLTEAVLQAQNPAEKARGCVQVAEAWAAARGKLLTAPLDTEDNRRLVFSDNAENANLQRRKNAAALTAASKFDEELESRDELRHAYQWWLKAADADPGSATAASSLWQALKAIPKIADVSSYTIQRALETGAEGESRTLYERLRKDYSQSREGSQFAVYWTIPSLPPADELPGWRDPNFSGSLSFEDAFGVGDSAYASNTSEWATLIARVVALKAHASDGDRGQLAAEASVLARRARQVYQSAYDDYLLNFLDDLELFLREPNLAPEVRKRYLDLRFACMRQTIGADPSALGGVNSSADSDIDADLRKQIAAALADPKMQPITDYLEFLDLAVVANHLIDVNVPGRKSDNQPFTYRSRDYALVESMAASFLVRYPKSAKREAATLLHARAIFMLSYPRRFKEFPSWPEAGRWGGSIRYWRVQREAFDLARVSAALDSYDQDFPNGRYAAEIASYRADILLRSRQWKPGLERTIAQLDDQSKPDLRSDAAYRLALLFNRLADENDRFEIMPLIRANQRESSLLVSYLNIDWPWHPLLYLKKYLANQSGGTLTRVGANGVAGGGGAGNGGGARVGPAREKEPAGDIEPSQPPPSVDRSSSRQAAPSYPGERYPQTRQRLLTMADVASLSNAQLRYAINEMYARHGATFPSQPPIEAQFRKFSWYHPNPMLTFEQIEDSFSQIERDNLALLGQVREMKKH